MTGFFAEPYDVLQLLSQNVNAIFQRLQQATRDTLCVMLSVKHLNAYAKSQFICKTTVVHILPIHHSEILEDEEAIESVVHVLLSNDALKESKPDIAELIEGMIIY